LVSRIIIVWFPISIFCFQFGKLREELKDHFASSGDGGDHQQRIGLLLESALGA
jgi:hypothetical protein